MAEEILVAAEQVFADKGFHEAGIADIAAVLGMGHGTFYRYFNNKQDIGTSVLERVIQRFAEAGRVEDPESAESLDAYQAQIHRILDRMLALVETDRSVVRFFHEQSGEWGLEGVPLGGPGRERPTAEALVGLIFEGTRRAVANPDVEARRRWARAWVDLVLRGMG